MKQSEALPSTTEFISVFLPILAGQSGTDPEFTFDMETAEANANGKDPVVSRALSQLEQSFTELFQTVGRVHFLQIAVQAEQADATPIETTLRNFNTAVSRELAQAKTDLKQWDAYTKQRRNQVTPALLAAGDSQFEIGKELKRLRHSILTAETTRHQAEGKYRAAGLSKQQMLDIKIEPTFEQIESWRFLIKGLETKQRLLQSFTEDFPRFRMERLQGVELPTLLVRQSQLTEQNKRLK
ncbi:hypothetical protein [Collimonas arenae]|uniref:hypothetical protein n=1 Tax=Collimonas arenae TaxID=279058 RepID=UPI000570366C|nr:hypothetical protein [Collimonas arenae]